MRTGKSIIVICLTATLAFQMAAPSSEVFAEEVGAVSSFAAKAADGVAGLVSSSDDATDGDFADADLDENAVADEAEISSSSNNQANEGSTNSEAVAAEDADEATAGDTDAASEQADAVDAATLAEGDFLTINQLRTALGNACTAWDDDGNGHVTSLTISNSPALIILSNADPDVYKNARITVSGLTGGNADLTGSATAEIDGSKQTFSFRGFGSVDVPFEGKFSNGSGDSLTMQTSRTIYNAISLTDENNAVGVIWKGVTSYSSPIVANRIIGNSKTLTTTVEAQDSTGETLTSSSAAISSSLMGTVEDALSVNATYSFTGTRKGININAGNGNAGLLANTLADGATFTVANVELLSNVEGTSKVATSAANAHAGGLVGDAGSGSTVKFGASVDLSKFEVDAKGSAGGVIGKAVSLTLDIPDTITITPASKVGSTSTANAGGIIGSVSFASSYTVKSTMFTFDDAVSLSTSRRAGGLFGELDVCNGDVTIDGGTYKSILGASQDNQGARGSYGGLIGLVYDSGSAANTSLPVLKIRNNTSAEFARGDGSSLYYIGGVVGYVGSADDEKRAVDVVLDGVSAKWTAGNAFSYVGDGRFGGAIGVLSGYCVADVKNLKVSTADNIKIGGANGGGAGVVGSAWRAAVKFSGTTDLSDAAFASSVAAQLIYEYWCSVAFATGAGSDNGWTLKRPNNAVEIDDIDSYGEVIRLHEGNALSSDLISIDDTSHKCKFSGNPLNLSNGSISLYSADDFVKLAIAYQAHGQFETVRGISYKFNESNLLGATINVEANIDLSRTGVVGLMKDGELKKNVDGVDDSSKVFSGTLQGSHTITLAVGEPFGKRGDKTLGVDDESAGNGKLYRHPNIGLFSQVNGATFKDVTIAGTMRFDDKHTSGVDAGALAARKTGGAVAIDNVTVTTAITYDSTNGSKAANVGGMIGRDNGVDSLTFKNTSKANATIKSHNEDVQDSCVGGVLGYVDVADTVKVDENNGLTIGGTMELVANNSGIPNNNRDISLAAGCFIGKIDGGQPVTVVVNGLTIGNSQNETDFKVTGKNRARVLAGGLIGYIPQGSESKTVTITGLAFDSFAMDIDVSAANNRTVGGLLGYSWGNTNLTLGGTSNNASQYAITTTSVSVSSEHATEFGGLVYVASGHWTVDQYAIDLSGASLSAPAADKFGMLACRGGSCQNQLGIDSAMKGLFLEDVAYWGDAYKVNQAPNAISAKNDSNFDEWVADTRRPDSRTVDSGVNGIVSLHVKDGDPVDMSGNVQNRNTYVNRTKFGQSHQTNEASRYYYNVDIVRKAVATQTGITTDGNISNANALYLWSVYVYAPSGLKSFIADSGWKTITTTSPKTIDANNGTIDLGGYSYYPVSYSGDIALSNTSLVFHHEDIRNEEAGNKSNAEKTQHANMHLSLLRDFSPSSSSSQAQFFTVSNVTLQGTVGIDAFDGGSGALVSVNVSGRSAATGGVTIGGLVLDGLKVDGAGSATGAAPLLVNRTSSYTNLTVRNLTTNENAYKNENGTFVTAATSLFGAVGGSDADMVSVTFSDGVSVPSKKGETIFSHASFLESFGYASGKSGSGSYTFYKKDEKSQHGIGVTYGSEIDSKGEWSGKQYWYYDSDTYGQEAGLVTDGEVTADKDEPKFGGYLPYVYKGYDMGENPVYHEIKVNHLVANLVTGCGTYGDPYVLSSASEVYAAANYIYSETAVADGWQIAIVIDQQQLCTRRHEDGSANNERVYTYSMSRGLWVSKDASDKEVTLDNDTMHRYLQSAYFSIEPYEKDNPNASSIELDGDLFVGFGSEVNPFRGVIVGNLKSGVDKAELKISKGKSVVAGLIPYSYGSVVKDVKVTYAGGSNSLTYSGKDSANVLPKTFFGGVIGCILGGDNIISGVEVGKSGGFSLASSGDKSHLVPMGGYIGAITGGGVIFRDMGTTSWRSDTKNNGGLYDNPFVGRVIDGYAFSEGCEVDNGSENYKINKLDTTFTNCVTTTDTYMRYRSIQSGAVTVNIKNTQGLLVLSAIINSGAAAGAARTTYEPKFGAFRGSRAYEGRYGEYPTNGYWFGNDQFGKVRNAKYDQVGTGAADTTEWENAKNDDRWAPGSQDLSRQKGPLDAQESDGINSPYLVKKYANWATGYICASNINGVKFVFAKDETFDMSQYGSGFLGLSGRYYSNACVSVNRAATFDPASVSRYYITPQVACIDGNGATIKVTNTLKEYSDDDYKASGAGGLFNNITFTLHDRVKSAIESNDGCTVRNLTFSDCTISIEYLDSAGNRVENNGDKQIGAGCLAGVTSNREALGDYGIYKNVNVESSSIEGTGCAGGLLGSAGYRRLANTSNNSMMVMGASGESSPMRLINCQVKITMITAQNTAGGFLGKMVGGVCRVDSKQNSKSTVEQSTITANRFWDEGATAGGIVGLTNAVVTVGANSSQDDRVRIVNTTITTDTTFNGEDSYTVTRGVGGIVGRAENSVSISQASIESNSDSSADTRYFGAKNGISRSSKSYDGKPNTGSATQKYTSIGGLIGCATSTTTVQDCSISGLRVAAFEASAALIGKLDTNQSCTIDGAQVSGVQIDGTYSGGIVGATNSNSNVVIKNASVNNCTFKANECAWTHDGGNYTYSGAVMGDTKGSIQMVNILLSENVFEDTEHQGLLFGEVGSASLTKAYVAGLDVKLASDKSNDDAPPLMKCYVDGNDNTIAGVNKKSYIAFGDYGDTNAYANNHVEGSALYSDTDTAVVAKKPYVTTSPVSSVEVSKSSDSTSLKLFGDGMSVDKVATIKNQAGTQENGKYTYDNIGGIDSGGNRQYKSNSYDSTSASTFNANNATVVTNPDGSVTDPVQVENDFPVLVIPGNDTTTIDNYLNVVTNGGYADALRLNGTTSAGYHVTAQAQTFVYDTTSEKFTKSDTSSLLVFDAGTNKMTYRASSDWDNDKHRFTLLTVTFKEADQEYKVQVPVLVKRMLEVDFTATYAYGTVFNKDAYSSLGRKYHVLSSFGDAMTGYLTWTYNQAYGELTEYGWDTHLDNGSAMGPMLKSLVFSGSNGTLPKGTQLTLVDTERDNREYHYTVQGDGDGKSVLLTDFVADDDATHYQEKWLSEIMNVSSKVDNSGAWVICPEAEVSKAGAKVGDTYYRAATADDASKQHYKLEVEKESDDTEKAKSESVYLIIRIPEGSTDKAVNGFTETSLGNTAINKNVNYTVRTAGLGKDQKIDGHENTASTYNVYSGYEQDLKDNATGGTVTADSVKDGVSYKLDFNVTDTVSFGAQEFNENDSLYFKLGASLNNYDNDTVASATGFPAGTSGEIKFYVRVGDKAYAWNGSSWVESTDADPIAIPAKAWQANGDDAAFVLSDADGNPIDLKDIRTIAKNNNTKFTIEVKAENGLSLTEAACQAGIVSSNEQEAKYTKIAYRATLSQHADSLNTSSMTAVNPGVRGYYRIAVDAASKISLTAGLVSQLGINIDDLQSADGTIALTGRYDFTDAKDGAAKLDAGSQVEYTLTLQRRKDDGGYENMAYGAGDSISNYISIVGNDQSLLCQANTDSFVFTDAKTSGGSFATRDGDSLALVLGFRVKVNTDVEAKKQFYSNYRIVLAARLTGDGVDDLPKNAQGLTGYDNSDYVTYTLTRVNTSGIMHSA